MRNKKLIGALTVALAGTMALGLAACGGKSSVHDDILNGGFEEGFKGWTRSGTAFSVAGVVDTDVVGPDNGKITAGKVGEYFFSGFDAGNPQFQGTLTSDPFKLGGTGKIGFLMGGGMDKEKCYVEFFEQGNDTALAKVANEAFAEGYITGEMVRVVVDLSAHVGKTVYIRITDSDKGDADEYAYLNLDDFVVYKTEADVTAAQQERAAKLAAIGKPAFSETETDTTIKNGGFEDGLVNWLMLDGSAFGTKALCSDDLFWADDAVDGMTATKNRPYNKEGNNFLNTYFNEDATGSIRSTKFTLAGDGIISFLMAGSPSNRNYVALCDAEGNELEKADFAGNFSDSALTENMVRHYIDASDHIGEVLYLKVVDGALPTGSFRGIVVDDFKVSQTQAEVRAQMKADFKKAQDARKTEPVSVFEAEYNYYNTKCDYPYTLEALRFTKEPAGGIVPIGESVDLTKYLDDIAATYNGTDEADVELVSIAFGETVTTTGLNNFNFAEEGTHVVTYKATKGTESIEGTFTLIANDSTKLPNGGFETGDMTGWTTNTPNFNMNTAVSSDTTYWGEQMPYNQSGSYHLDGWTTGIPEEGTWTVTSSDFVLGGAGIITVKMGGHAAAVKVYMRDGTNSYQIGYYKQTRFNDANFPHIAGGGSWADMATYVIGDLQDYIGKTLYIELLDEPAAGWANAFFDDVITYYPADTTVEALLENEDTVTDGHTQGDPDNGVPAETPSETTIAWVRATNLTPKGTIVLTEKVEGYMEFDHDEVAEFALEAFLNSHVKGIVVGDASKALTVNVTEIKAEDGTTVAVADFAPAAGKAYTVKYTVSYDGNENDPIELTVTLKFLAEGDIHNGGFETGDLTGWTVEGNGASVSNGSVYWEGDESFFDQNGVTVQSYLKEGNYFLITADGEGSTVTLKSETFTVTGDYITFKFGIAKNSDSYVAVCDAETDEELVKVTNEAVFDDPTKAQVLLRRFVDVSALQGKEVYVKVVDGATADFGFLNFDDLRVNMTEEQAQALLTADQTWAATYRDDVINSTESMGEKAKAIVEAIRSYYEELSLENAPKATLPETAAD